MEDLALVYVTCDKYEHIWKDWYDGYCKYFDIDIPSYFCGESKPCPWDFKTIPHEPVPASQWTTKLKTQLEQIPENNVFIWLDDLIAAKDITFEFEYLYDCFLQLEADALRIMMRASAARTYAAGRLMDRPIEKLLPKSPYLISYSPNIYKKDFLLHCLRWEESPWENELHGTARIRPWMKDIYSYQIDGWCYNSIIKGEKK